VELRKEAEKQEGARRKQGSKEEMLGGEEKQ